MSNPKTAKYLIGIDEVGRGPLAGPVTVGVFCVAQGELMRVKKQLQGITDSKKLSEKKRMDYVEAIKVLKRDNKLQYSTSSVSARLIDRHGIMWAVQTALNRALKRANRNSKDSYVFLDGGLKAPKEYSQQVVIKGDQKNWLIGAASVVAKVTRDEKMKRCAKKYPSYGFEKHKGYGTLQHRLMIKEKGTTSLHRLTWVKEIF